jgi:hypothetical protein
MYANVDQNGHLGSNVGVVSADQEQEGGAGRGPLTYDVVFSKPIITCAVAVQPGFVDGQLTAAATPSVIFADHTNPDTVTVQFGDDPGSGVTTAFMMTATCPS